LVRNNVTPAFYIAPRSGTNQRRQQPGEVAIQPTAHSQTSFSETDSDSQSIFGLSAKYAIRFAGFPSEIERESQ
jgi:hypothetical protein